MNIAVVPSAITDLGIDDWQSSLEIYLTIAGYIANFHLRIYVVVNADRCRTSTIPSS